MLPFDEPHDPALADLAALRRKEAELRADLDAQAAPPPPPVTFPGAPFIPDGDPRVPWAPTSRDVEMLRRWRISPE